MTNEAIAARITALERAVKRGIAVAAQPAAPVTAQPETEETKEEPEPAAPASEPEPEKEQEEKPAPKPQPKPPVMPRQNQVDVVQLSRNAVPFPQWSEIVESFRRVSPAIAAALAGSEAFENGLFLLIKADSDLAFDLLNNAERRKQIRNALIEQTGKQYRLGPYRLEEKKLEETDPLQSLKQRLKESGIEYTEE